MAVQITLTDEDYVALRNAFQQSDVPVETLVHDAFALCEGFALDIACLRPYTGFVGIGNSYPRIESLRRKNKQHGIG